MSLRLRVLAVCWLAACGSTAKPVPPPMVAPPPGPPPAVAATPAADPPQPTLRLPRNFLPTGYRARLAIDPASDGFTGAIEIDGELRERSQRIWLHGRKLTVASAKITQGARVVRVEVAPAGDELLSLRPVEPLDPGHYTLALDYRGSFDLNEGTGAYKRTLDDAAYVATQFESTSARRVFPCFDEPDNKVPWQLTLDVPRALVAVTNTPPTSETALDDKTKRVVFAPTRPLPSYLLAFGVGPYQIVDAGKTRGGTPIRIIALRGRAKEAAWSAETTAKIIQLLEDYFGTPYPYPKLDQLSTAFAGYGAMENPGLVIYGKTLILRDPASITPSERYEWVGVAAHELAHQWFGDLVTMAWWDDIWLNEGFASWLGSKITGAFDPAWRGDLISTVERGGALDADSSVSARRIRQPIASAGDIFDAFDNITYAKGASVLAMFEHAIGPDKFRDGVRAYVAAHRDGNATSKDFLSAISAVAGRDVAPAFGSFLDQAGAPVVRAELRCAAGQAPVLQLSQHRYVLPGSPEGASGVPWHIPVCVAFERGGKRAEACTELTTETTQLALDTKICPTWMFPNAGGRGYYRSSQADAGIVALRDRGWTLLTPAERIVAFGDLKGFAATGEVDVGLALSFVPRLLAEHNRFGVFAAMGIAQEARGWLADDQRPRFDAWIRTTFGPLARGMGWLPRAKDDLDAARERLALIGLVAWRGDPTLRAAAVGLARRWQALGATNRDDILGIAADADGATFDRLLAAMPTEHDPELRLDLVRGLSQVTAEPQLRQVLALTFDPRVERREARQLLFAGREPAQQQVVDAFFRAHLAELQARFPDEGLGTANLFAHSFLRGCDAARRDDALAFVRAHFGKGLGAERAIASAIEDVDKCIAARALLGPKLAAWLARPAR
jgi:cytosol alanyl aminopeptidase